MLEYAFMQRALVAAVAIGLLCGTLGFFVVLRRLAFIGFGISHSAIGGVAIGLLLGWPPLATAGVFAVAVALGIAWSRDRVQLEEDALIGVFLSGAMALGVLLFSLQRGGQQDLFGYLFGNVLAISNGELAVLLLLCIGVIGVLAWIHRDLLFLAFDEEAAKAYGHAVRALNTALLVLLALTIVVGVRLVGALLVQALLVVPAVVAALWFGDFRRQVVAAAAIGAGCGATGLIGAYRYDVAPGASIVLVAVTLFFASLLVRRATPS